MELDLNTDIASIQNRKGISGSTLKFIAVFSMLIDHIAASVLLNPLVNANSAFMISLAHVMRMFGRLAFSIFCFLLIEGFLHTKNRKKYALRLALFALISEIPFDLAFSYKSFDFSYQNVFFTLLIGLLVMIGFQTITDRWNEKKWLIVQSTPSVSGSYALNSDRTINNIWYKSENGEIICTEDILKLQKDTTYQFLITLK